MVLFRVKFSGRPVISTNQLTESATLKKTKPHTIRPLNEFPWFPNANWTVCQGAHWKWTPACPESPKPHHMSHVTHSACAETASASRWRRISGAWNEKIMAFQRCRDTISATRPPREGATAAHWYTKGVECCINLPGASCYTYLDHLTHWLGSWSVRSTRKT